ncbi:MAG: GAF domain-containing sensor histidine kinase [Acidobacteriota bacterium]
MDTIAEFSRSDAETDHILPDLLKLACRTNTAEVGVVALVDGGTGDLVVRHTYGTAFEELAVGARLPQGKGISGWSIANRKTALVADVATDPRFAFHGRRDLDFAPRDLVCVPLMSGDKAFGVVVLFNKTGGTFDEADASLMESVGSLAANAVENARLYEVERRDRRLAQTLAAFSMAITQSLDVNVVLRVLLDYLAQLVPCDQAAAMLVEYGSRFAVRVLRGREGTAVLDPESQASFDASAIPVLRELLDGQKGGVVQDIRPDPAWAPYPGADGTRSWLGVPLVVGGRVIGMYSLAKGAPGFYQQEHLDLAGALAYQASAAVQSAWLFERVGEGRARLQSLSRQLVRIQESERRAVSRELHDEAGQSLASLKVGLHLLEAKVGDRDAIRAGITDLQQQVEGLMVSLHRLASNLRPASLDHVGLSAAVQQMVEALNVQGGPRVEFEGYALVGRERLPDFTETALYRIVQEALTNSVRHSRAKCVSVLLKRREDRVVVVIEDDGVGFDPVLALHCGRLGLLGMRERAEMVGGSLVIESSQGKGTTVVAEVPDADPDSAG